MWWPHDYRRKVDCYSDDVEIRFEMFLRYLVALILNRSLSDVLRHIRADVCLQPIYALSANRKFAALSTKILLRSLQITLRRRSLALGAPPPVTTSTRIPVLSP